MTPVQRSPRQPAATLTIKSRTEKLALVREFVSDSARRFGFDEEVTNKIALAVDEACTNVIKHSYKFATDKEITVNISTANGAFEITIMDEGLSFDPQTIPHPDMKEYLSQYRRGGLGMHLMRSLVDKVEYHSFPGKGNEVRLIKYRTAT
jgi:serine/threonine-protein kinase RsbW